MVPCLARMLPRFLLLSLPLSGFLSCSGDFGLQQSRLKDTFQQSASVSADVLFVVDNSQSMVQEQALVVDAFTDFIQNIRDSNVDFHIGVTTTDMNAGGAQGKLITYNSYRYITAQMDPALYQQVFAGMVGLVGTGSGWEKGLWAAKSALYPTSEGGQGGPNGYNAGFLRDDAKLAIIFVSDENDCSDEGNPLPGQKQEECYTLINELRPVYEYVADYQSLKNDDDDVIVSAIVGLQGVDPESECGKNTSGGSRYIETTRDFGGIVGDICQSEFSSILSQMGLSAAGIQSHFVLSRTPDPTSIEVYVNEQQIPSSAGWAYDPETNAVDFYGQAIPPRDSIVVISYTL